MKSYSSTYQGSCFLFSISSTIHGRVQPRLSHRPVLSDALFAFQHHPLIRPHKDRNKLHIRYRSFKNHFTNINSLLTLKPPPWMDDRRYSMCNGRNQYPSSSSSQLLQGGPESLCKIWNKTDICWKQVRRRGMEWRQATVDYVWNIIDPM